MTENTDHNAFDFEKAYQQYEEWENSPQGIRYNLHMVGGDDSDLEALIVFTVMRLPEDVKQYLYDDCLFASVGNGIAGMVWAPTQRWLIFLDSSIVNTGDVDECQGIIAHEIAHAWLKHDQLDPKITTQCEIDATNLAAQWGFKGRGADLADVYARYPSLR